MLFLKTLGVLHLASNISVDLDLKELSKILKKDGGFLPKLHHTCLCLTLQFSSMEVNGNELQYNTYCVDRSGTVFCTKAMFFLPYTTMCTPSHYRYVLWNLKCSIWHHITKQCYYGRNSQQYDMVQFLWLSKRDIINMIANPESRASNHTWTCNDWWSPRAPIRHKG